MKKLSIVLLTILITFNSIFNTNVKAADVPIAVPLVQNDMDKSKLFIIAGLLAAMGLTHKSRDNFNYINGKVFKALKDNAGNFAEVTSATAGKVMTITAQGYTNLKGTMNTLFNEKTIDSSFITDSGLFKLNQTTGGSLSSPGGAYLVPGSYILSFDYGASGLISSALYNNVVGWHWEPCPDSVNSTKTYHFMADFADGTKARVISYEEYPTCTIRATPYISNGVTQGQSICVTPPSAYGTAYHPDIDATKSLGVPEAKVTDGSLTADNLINRPYNGDIDKTLAIPGDITTGTGEGTQTGTDAPTSTGDTTADKWYTPLTNWLQRILDAIKAIPGAITKPIIDFFTIDWDAIKPHMDYAPVFQAHFKPFYDITGLLQNIQANPQSHDGKFYMKIPKEMGGDDQEHCVLDLSVGAVYITTARKIIGYGIWIALLWFIIKQFSPKLRIS